MYGSAPRSRRSLPVSSALVVAVAISASLLTATPALARSAGIDSAQFTPMGGCNDCHSGGVAPQVSLNASAASVAPGEQLTLSLSVTSQSSAQIAAGFNLRSSQRGTFAVGGPDATGTRTIANANTGWLEATHNAAKNASAGVTTFSTLWTPDPGVTGPVTFTAWGNSVNRANGRNGDRSSVTSITVTVCTPATFYRDADGDGYGNAADALSACAPPPGYVADSSDCDDTAAGVHPGATELCNGHDDDCDAAIDEDLGALTCGEPPCQTTVPACLDGVPQTCTPTCPAPDAAPPPESDAAPPAEMDAAPPPEADAGDPTPGPDAAGGTLPDDPDHVIPLPDPAGCACEIGSRNAGISLPMLLFALAIAGLRRRPR
jgi:hypothetical protein